MPHGIGIVFILGLYLLIVIILLTMLWRIANALERISRHLQEMAQDLKKLSERP